MRPVWLGWGCDVGIDRVKPAAAMSDEVFRKGLNFSTFKMLAGTWRRAAPAVGAAKIMKVSGC